MLNTIENMSYVNTKIVYIGINVYSRDSWFNDIWLPERKY